MSLDQLQLDKQSSVPLAEQLANALLHNILNGHLAPGEKLPTERELAEALGIARGTVKRAYARLQQSSAIEIRQGSGSYVLANGAVLEESQKREAAEMVSSLITRLGEMGLSDREIMSLITLQMPPVERMRSLSVLVLSNNHEILSELEAQLSYLTASARVSYGLSFVTIENIIAGRKPVQQLLGYDLIIATSIDYPAILELVPMYQHKIIEASVSPRTRTLISLSELPREGKVSIVYRTPVFLDMARHTLVSLGFREENLLLYKDREYQPEHHGAHGVTAVVGFNEAPMFVQPEFREANDAFTQAGGRLIRFEYRIDRGSLTNIEDRIQDLLSRE